MQADGTNRIEALFHAACSRPAGAERAAFLDGACGDDGDLRARVEALLAAHEEAEGFLEGPAVEGRREGPGSSIGPYKLLQEIGEGGMGVVYMAEQERPVRRKVAVKVIKLGMDTKQVIARFEAERQALAMMDHASIARVLDAGSTEAGRPYFVMELVRGVPINEYCDTHKLSTDARLGLFVDVCRAVQHAHQKGVIHRDLKPTNVLVTSHDGTPVPKIIDFGVAKATNQRLTERTLFTEFHQFIGTPEYMSPEQAEMSGLDVDTRSDIYALGVLLYQLLTGSTPADPTDLRTAGFEEMTRMIREEEPQAPSTRVSELDADGHKIANHDSQGAGALSRHFRGDLDWIVMKALEKDRTRRYETASAFAQDVVRHLGNQPVEAGPPGTLYRLGKFVRRNRKAMVAALVLAAVVGLGLAGTTAGFVSARDEAARSGAIGDSLQDVLAMTDPARGADRAEVEGVLATVREVFGEEHATYAAVLDTLALRLHDAGDFAAAAELCRESLGVWESVHGEAHPNVAIAHARLGRYLRAQGDAEGAESALRTALAGLAHSQATGLAVHEARVELADLLRNRGVFDEADELLGEALTALRASASPAPFRILQTLELRAAIRVNQPNGDATETVREVYEEANAFYPDDSPMLAMIAFGYGRMLFQDGELEAAEPYLREAVQRFRAAPNPPDFYYVAAGELLFQILRGRDDTASVLEGDELLGELIGIARAFWNADVYAETQRFYAKRLQARGRDVDALDALAEAFAALVGAGRPADERDRLRGDLAEHVLALMRTPDVAPAVCARARDAVELALQDEIETLVLRAVLGAVLYRQGEHALAAETLDALDGPLRDASRIRARKVAPVVHAFRALAHARLGDDALARDELDALCAAFTDEDGGETGRALVAEIEALLERTPQNP